MRHLHALLGPVVALMAASPAAAQGFEDWASGPWQVYRGSGDCWLIHSGDDGAELTLSVARVIPDFFISLKSPDFASVKAREPAPAQVSLGEVQFTANSRGASAGTVAGMLDKPSAQVMPIFARAKHIGFSARGKVFNLPLNATARNKFIACAATLGGGR